jgi:hypothetical protein
VGSDQVDTINALRAKPFSAFLAPEQSRINICVFVEGALPRIAVVMFTPDGGTAA